MIIWDVVRVLLRQWVIVVVGGVITVGCGLLVIRDNPVFFTRTEIAFLAPTSSVYPNALRTQSEDIIETAGVVAKRVTGASKVTKYAAPEVTLVGLGVRDGWSLRLPDTGGQWATNFATQKLTLDVVSPSRAETAARQQALLDQIGHELLTLQQAAGVDPVDQITMLPAPQSTVIFQVSGNRQRALMMTALLGGLLTVAVALAVERRRRARRALSRESTTESAATQPPREAALVG